MNNTQNNNKKQISQEKVLFIIILILSYLLGVFFRIYLLNDQVLLDDEWHSMAFVIDKPFVFILTHFAVPNGFTSIPLNIYDWILLNSIGWSETWLRLPSILLGLICLIFGPILAKSIIGIRAAIILSLLIAISPILIFYSRVSRPYSAVVCLGFFCILYAARWMKFGKIFDGLSFAICGVLAVYWHPFAAITVGTIAASMLLTCIWHNTHNCLSIIKATPSWRQTGLIIASMGAVGAILMLPAILNSLHNSMFDVAQQGTIQLSSWLRTSSLFAGTANTVMNILFWGLIIAGIIHLWENNKWLAGTLATCFPMQMLALILSRPHSCHVGIVLTRYSIILVPVSLLLVACALQSFLTALNQRNHSKPLLNWLLICAFIATLFLTGPLYKIMSKPNNFTNHRIFQHKYGQIDWSHSFHSDFVPAGFPLRTEIRTDEVSGFYRFLRENCTNRIIVEYPMTIGDHFNPYYFYQWYHQRPVIIGYTTGISNPTPLKGRGVYGNTYVDEVLNITANYSKLHFYNFIDMNDFSNMRRQNVEYIIFHKQFEADLSKIAPPPRDFNVILEKYRRKFYVVYEDENITVFSMETNSKITTKQMR
jgi:hypothetical protein